MSFRFKKIDNNQTSIVKELRRFGASVQSIASVGRGAPDLLVGYRAKNYLFEVKRRDGSPSQKQLTADELKWQEKWRGQCYVIDTAEQALRVIGAVTPDHVAREL